MFLRLLGCGLLQNNARVHFPAILVVLDILRNELLALLVSQGPSFVQERTFSRKKGVKKLKSKWPLSIVLNDPTEDLEAQVVR